MVLRKVRRERLGGGGAVEEEFKDLFIAGNVGK